jgi:hypothetical protein
MIKEEFKISYKTQRDEVHEKGGKTRRDLSQSASE